MRDCSSLLWSYIHFVGRTDERDKKTEGVINNKWQQCQMMEEFVKGGRG